MPCLGFRGSAHPLAIFVDIVIFFSALVVLLCTEWGVLKPLKTIGFYCHDPKLNFVNNGDTVTVSVLLVTTFLLPWPVCLMVEWFSASSTGMNHKDGNNKCIWMERARCWYHKYLYGICFTFFITNLAKLLVGEPRPHFFNTCVPEQMLKNCSENHYIEEYTCTSHQHEGEIADASKSFPSGHASFSSYFATFMVCYVTASVRTDSKFLVHFLQILFIFWAMFCSFSRVTDHRHHWWDVLAGSILGIGVAIYFFQSEKGKQKSGIVVEDGQSIPSHLINNCNE